MKTAEFRAGALHPRMLEELSLTGEKTTIPPNVAALAQTLLLQRSAGSSGVEAALVSPWQAYPGFTIAGIALETADE